MKKKFFMAGMAVIALAFIAVGQAFAQSKVTLSSGTYKYSGLSGKGKLVLHPLNAGKRNAVLYGADGTAVGRGTWQVEGSTLKVNLTSGAAAGFETFTIISNTSFVGDVDGLTYYRTGDA